MPRGLAVKLTLAFLFVSLTGTGLFALLARQGTAAEFGHYMTTQNLDAEAVELAAYYRAHGGWAGVETRAPFDTPAPTGNGGMLERMNEMGMSMAPILADADGTVLIGGLGYSPGTRLSTADQASATPITVDTHTVGFLLGRDMAPANTPFLERITSLLTTAALGTTAVALVLAALLAHALTRPLRELTAATHALAAGQLGAQVPVRSTDELGTLAHAFNQMSAALAAEHERRRQMTADIAHELRTPLSVILGHAEALQDGVLPPAPETFALLHTEAQRLSRLVNDLRTLSLAEAGELDLTRRPTAPADLLTRALAAHTVHAQQHAVTLTTTLTPNLPTLPLDPERISQVLDNLLDNALRHTPAGGQITLSAAPGPHNTTRFTVRDTGPGIAPTDLPHIFERFYRADKARRRDQANHGHGGSGLGLAIARSLVNTHGGTLSAESTLGHGTTMIMDLPNAASMVH